ncbi:ECF transporter S component [Ligilactobacillus sp. LYQ135]
MDKSTKKLVLAAVLGAVSFILMFIAFPIIPIVPYMKLDFSDLVILIGALIYNKKEGYVILGIKEILYLLFVGLSLANIVGVLADALAGFILIKILGDKILASNWKYLIIKETLILSITMSLANAFILLPIYTNVIGMKLTFPIWKIVLIGVIPFNIIKGIIVGLLFRLAALKVKTQL